MIMRITLSKALAIAVVATVFSAHAQTLTDSWTYAGGGLDPATYGTGVYRPATFIPDAASDNGATIGQTGLTSGGLGSSGFPDGYGGIYTFFSANPTFTLQTSTILDGLDTITISFLAGGGSPSLVAYTASSLTLNYNGLNPSLASSAFEAIPGFIVESPLGDQNLTLYTWTWTDLSARGSTSGFSASWNTQANQHAFFTDISLTQAVPEPSATCLIALGGVVCLLRRKRRDDASDLSDLQSYQGPASAGLYAH